MGRSAILTKAAEVLDSEPALNIHVVLDKLKAASSTWEISLLVLAGSEGKRAQDLAPGSSKHWKQFAAVLMRSAVQRTVMANLRSFGARDDIVPKVVRFRPAWENFQR